MKHLYLLLFGWILCGKVFASPAYPGRVPVVLPSGDTVYVRLRGDEFLKWAETEDGYTLLRDSFGEWTYAVPSPVTGKAMASEWKLLGKAGKSAAAFSDFLRTVPRRLMPQKHGCAGAGRPRGFRSGRQPLRLWASAGCWSY